MKYNVVPTERFLREARRISKKFPSLSKELADLSDSLSNNPFQGAPLGRHCYKIRLAIHSKGKGKSGSARVITLVRTIRNTVYVLTIYDKSETSMVSDADLRAIIRKLNR